MTSTSAAIVEDNTNLKSKIVDFAAVIAGENTYFSLLGMPDVSKNILKILNKNVYFDTSIFTEGVNIKKGDIEYSPLSGTWLLYKFDCDTLMSCHDKIHEKIYHPNIYCNKNGDEKIIFSVFIVECKFYISAFKRPVLINDQMDIFSSEEQLIAAEIFLKCKVNKHDDVCCQKIMIKGDNIVKRVIEFIQNLKFKMNDVVSETVRKILLEMGIKKDVNIKLYK